MDKLEFINKALSRNEDKLNLIYDILSLPKFVSKADLMKLAQIENNVKVDTDTPINYYGSIEEIYPEISRANLVYDYNDNIYGTMRNINNDIVSRILKTK